MDISLPDFISLIFISTVILAQLYFMNKIRKDIMELNKKD